MKTWLKQFFPKQWKNLFFFNLFLLFFIGLIGSSVSLESNEINNILNQVNQIIPKDINVISIFLNNFIIALIMIIPIIGLLFAITTIYQTGMVFAAAASIENLSGTLLYVVTALTPFFWLEFITYAANITQGIFIFLALLKKQLTNEITRTIIIITISFSFLFMGSIIEMVFIGKFIR